MSRFVLWDDKEEPHRNGCFLLPTLLIWTRLPAVFGLEFV